MIISEMVRGETRVFLAAMLWGGEIVLLYDIIRILRRVFIHGDFLVCVEDMCFWIFTALGITRILYINNNGSIRLYIILAMLMGAVVYYFTISRRLVQIAARILIKIKKIIFAPFCTLHKTTTQYIEKHGKSLKKLVKFNKKRLQMWIKEVIMVITHR